MKKRLSIIKIILVVPLLLILGFEIGLRVLVPEKLKERRHPEYVSDSTIGFKYKPFAKGERINVAFRNKYSINSLGFNWDEFSKEKPDNIFRIMVVGHSDDTGIDTDGPNNYIRLLKKYFKNDSVEILNFSLDGYSRSYRNNIIVNEICFKYNPDLILMRFELPIKNKNEFRTSYRKYIIGYTDLNQSLDSVKNFIDTEFYSPSIKKAIYDYSYCYRYMSKYCTERKDAIAVFLAQRNIVDLDFMHPYIKKTIFRSNSDIPTVSTNTIQESMNIYNKTKQRLDSIDCRFALFSTYQVSGQDQIGQDLLEKMGVACISLDIIQEPAYSFGEKNDHSNQKGHKVIADKFYEKLLSNGFIPHYYLSNETQNKLSELKKESNLGNEESNFQPNTDSLFITKLPRAKESNYAKILLLINEESGSRYSEYLKELFIEGEDKVELIVIKSEFPQHCEDYLKMINTEFIEHRPDLILSEEPTSIIIESTNNPVLMLGNFNKYLNKNSCEIVLFNPMSGTEESVVQYIMETEGVESMNVGVTFPLSEIMTMDAEYLNDLAPRLVADNLYSKLRTKYINPKYINPSKNVALNKKVYVSSGYNEWGWSNQSVVDGKRFHSALSRGWTSWEYMKNKNHTEWIMLDLDHIASIKDFVIYPRNDVGFEGMGFPIDFNIQVSTDSVNWSKVLDIKDYPKPNNWKPQKFTIEENEARYILIEGTNLPYDKDPRGATYLMSFTEIEIY